MHQKGLEIDGKTFTHSPEIARDAIRLLFGLRDKYQTNNPRTVSAGGSHIVEVTFEKVADEAPPAIPAALVLESIAEAVFSGTSS